MIGLSHLKPFFFSEPWLFVTKYPELATAIVALISPETILFLRTLACLYQIIRSYSRRRNYCSPPSPGTIPFLRTLHCRYKISELGTATFVALSHLKQFSISSAPGLSLQKQPELQQSTQLCFSLLSLGTIFYFFGPWLAVTIIAGARQDPGGEEADERFVESLSACLEEIDSAAAAAATMPGEGRGSRRVQERGRSLPLSSSVGAGTVVLVGSAESLERVPASLRRCFTHEVGRCCCVISPAKLRKQSTLPLSTHYTLHRLTDPGNV